MSLLAFFLTPSYVICMLRLRIGTGESLEVKRGQPPEDDIRMEASAQVCVCVDRWAEGWVDE